MAGRNNPPQRPGYAARRQREGLAYGSDVQGNAILGGTYNALEPHLGPASAAGLTQLADYTLPFYGGAATVMDGANYIKGGDYGMGAAMIGLGSLEFLPYAGKAARAVNMDGAARFLADESGAFAGINARTADLTALKRAQDMAEAGASRDAIWNDTGWFKGVDDKWRFEIDDSGAFPYVNTRDGVLMSGSGRYGDVMLHDDLTAAYPDLADIDTIYQNSPQRGGQYQPFEDRSAFDLMDLQEQIDIRGTTPTDFSETALHEAQHAIQRREGFARGGNAALGREMSQEPILGDMEALQDYIRSAKRSLASSADPNGSYETGLRESIADAERELAELQARVAKRPRTAFEAYQRIAGEAEARNVERRMNMTAAQRRATPPWKTLDVPEDEIVTLGVSR